MRVWTCLFLMGVFWGSPLFAQGESDSEITIEVLGESEREPEQESSPAPVPEKSSQRIEPQTSASSSTTGSSNMIPTTERIDPVSWNARLGFGTAINPSVFWLSFDAEVQLDKFIALGPTIQFGYGDPTTYTMASVGPRFTLPISYVEWYVGGGAGMSYRDQANIRFRNFMFEMHTGLEVYLFKELSVGAAYRFNWISSQALDHISVVTFYVSGHF